MKPEDVPNRRKGTRRHESGSIPGFRVSPTFLRDIRYSLFPPAIRDSREFFRQLAGLVARSLVVPAVSIWTNNYQGSCLVLQAAYPETHRKLYSTVIPRTGSLGGMAVDRCQAVFHDARATAAANSQKWREIPDAFPIQSMLSIPVINLFNIRLVTLVLNVYFDKETLPSVESSSNNEMLSDAAAVGFDHVLHKTEDEFRHEIGNALLQCHDLAGLFENVTPAIRRATNCDKACLYSWIPKSRELVEEGGDRKMPPSHILLNQTWREDYTDLLRSCLTQRRGVMSNVSEDAAHTLEPFHPYRQMAVPIPGMGKEPLGVIYCSRSALKDENGTESFSSVELDALEAVARALEPHMDRFLKLRMASSVVNALTDVVKTSPKWSIQQILDFTIEEIVKAFGGSHGSIFLYEEHTDELVGYAATQRARSLIGKPYKLDDEVPGVTAYFAKEKKIGIFRSRAEIENHPSFRGKFDQDVWGKSTEGCKNLFLVPITAGEALLGLWKVTNVTSSESHPDPNVTEEDIQLAQVLSSFLASSILRTRNEELKARFAKFLVEGFSKIATAENEDDAILAAVQVLEEQKLEALISFYDPKERVIKGAFATSPNWREIRDDVRSRIDGKDILAVVLESGIPRFIKDSRVDEHCDRTLMARASIEAQYVVPLRLGSERIGTLQVALGKRSSLDGTEDLFFSAFCAYLAVAISRCRAIAVAADRADEEMRKSRFIIAETLAGAVVHSARHVLKDMDDQLDSHLALQDVRQNRDLYELFKGWKPKLREVRQSIDDTLGLVKAQSSENTLGPIDLHSEIQHVVSTWYPFIRANKCAIQVKPDAKMHTAIISFQALREILSVLIINSVQAHARKIEIATANPSDVRMAKGYNIRSAVSILVRDDGEGLQTDDHEILFSPSYTTKRSRYGTGLGLFIARRLARDWGAGDLIVAGKGFADKGVAFQVLLPVFDGAKK